MLMITSSGERHGTDGVGSATFSTGFSRKRRRQKNRRKINIGIEPIKKKKKRPDDSYRLVSVGYTTPGTLYGRERTDFRRTLASGKIRIYEIAAKIRARQTKRLFIYSIERQNKTTPPRGDAIYERVRRTGKRALYNPYNIHVNAHTTSVGGLDDARDAAGATSDQNATRSAKNTGAVVNFLFTRARSLAIRI